MRFFRLLFASLLVSLASLMSGCDLPGRPDPAKRPVPADEVLEFALLFRQNCAGCHGTEGKLGPAPPLNDRLFRAIVPEETLNDIITKGRPKTLMPAFAKENGGTLTATQIQVLVKEIKGIAYKIVEKPGVGGANAEIVSHKGGMAPTWGAPQWNAGEKPPVGLPSYLEESTASLAQPGDKDKGAVVFGWACAKCHGEQGQGIGTEKVKTINDRVFLSLVSDQALRRYVITGLPERGMPNYATHSVPLTERDVADLVALLAAWRQGK